MKTTLSDSEIRAIQDEAKKTVQVSCDEYHSHSALQGCLKGDEKDITICKLTEVLLRERQLVRDVTSVLGKES